MKQMVIEVLLLVTITVLVTVMVVGIPFTLLTLAGVKVPQVLVATIAALVASVTANLLMSL
jgi:hypothetical protein